MRAGAFGCGFFIAAVVSAAVDVFGMADVETGWGRAGTFGELAIFSVFLSLVAAATHLVGLMLRSGSVRLAASRHAFVGAAAMIFLVALSLMFVRVFGTPLTGAAVWMLWVIAVVTPFACGFLMQRNEHSELSRP